MSTGQRYSDAATMIERLGELIEHMEQRVEECAQELAQPRIAAAEDAAALRATWASSEVERREQVITELHRQIDAALKARDRAHRECSQVRAEMEQLRSRLGQTPTVALVSIPPIGDILTLVRTGDRCGELREIANPDGECISLVECAYDGDDDDLYDSAVALADQLGWVVTDLRTVAPDRWILQGAQHLDI